MENLTVQVVSRMLRKKYVEMIALANSGTIPLDAWHLDEMHPVLGETWRDCLQSSELRALFKQQK